MRSLAAFIESVKPDICAVCDIESGDALALATRFIMQWAYRGGQAVFWNKHAQATEILDEYLPFSPRRPFERRGLVRVDLRVGSWPARVYATQIGAERDQRIRDLRYLRAALRDTSGACMLFCVSPPSRIEYGDLGFTRAGCRGVDGETLWLRGFDVQSAQDDKPHRGIGTPLVAKLRLTGRLV